MQNSSSGTKRSSKWDQMTNEAVNHGSINPSVAAAEVAAKLNAKLAAEGKLIQSTPPSPPTSAASSSVLASVPGASKGQQQMCGFFTAEVDINNSLARSELIKTTTLTEINRATGAFVSVRGKYLTMEEQKDGNQVERLQYLHVQSTTQERVNNAVDRIKAIIAGEATNKQSFSQQHYVQDKVFIGMDGAPEAFKLLDRLSGPGGSYLAHIAQQTGAKVYLRGKGSGFLEPTSGREAFEALYLYISHPDHNGMVQAKKLCESLVSTVRKELQQFTASPSYGAVPLAQGAPPMATLMAAPGAAGAGYNYMQQVPFYASYRMGSPESMGSHDPRTLSSQQYGGQPFPMPHPPPPGAGMGAPPFPPYFAAMPPPPPPPYMGAPPQPFAASSVPPQPYPVPSQAPIPPLMPPVSTHSETTSATEAYSVSSADDNKISSSGNVYTLTQNPATVSTSHDLPAPSKPAKRRFTEKPNLQAEVLKSSLSVNTYTDVASDTPQSVSDAVDTTSDVDTTSSGCQDNKIVSQHSEATGEDNQETVELQVLCTGDKLHPRTEKNNDKWKPVIDTSEKDKLLMPPPGGFLRSTAGKRQRPVSKPKETVEPLKSKLLELPPKDEKTEEDNDAPAKKLKLVVYGDSDSDND